MNNCQKVDDMLEDVHRIMLSTVEDTSLRDHVTRLRATVSGGKMLRAKLILHVGTACGVATAILKRTAAAVEMLHTASLLHDDILDGGTLRRGNPALWVSEGIKTAVILGDLLVSLAVEVIQDVLPSHLPLLTATLREMCDAEAEQEFAGIETSVSWEKCVSIARRKTGSLFGFAAACAGGLEPERVEALRRAGYALGTAYQLVDDLWDAGAGDPAASDKTLGRDAATGKLTAASALPPSRLTPQDVIESLLRESECELARWPQIQAVWQAYVSNTIGPLVAKLARGSRAEAVA